MVGASGFEPPASWSRTRRASQAALRPEMETEYIKVYAVFHGTATGHDPKTLINFQQKTAKSKAMQAKIARFRGIRQPRNFRRGLSWHANSLWQFRASG